MTNEEKERIRKLISLIQRHKLITTGDTIIDAHNGTPLFVFVTEGDTSVSLCTPVGLKLCDGKEIDELYSFCKNYARTEFYKNVDTIFRNKEALLILDGNKETHDNTI